MNINLNFRLAAMVAKNNARAVTTWALLVGCLTGCNSKQQQLEHVARDWCMVIRASQVIPVYPLTEDLEPGDLLLVRTSVEDQVAQYEAEGFLPLDHRITRLDVQKTYKHLYGTGYGLADNSHPPRNWQHLSESGLHNWSFAPRAAFPTYSFTVHNGAGINLAVPVSGVPVALGLLGASSATGSITIADVYTYAVDDFHLRPLVDEWAVKNSEYLRNFRSVEGRTNYLRVVSRVFLTGGVDVAISADKSFGGTASGGAAKSVDVLATAQGDAAANYANALAAINKTVSDALPGGTVKVASASSRSVSLVEKFPRPLVIGYLAFDYAIDENGQLQLPVPTRAIIEHENIHPATKWGPDNNSTRIENWLKTPENRELLKAWLVEQGHDPALIPNITLSGEHAELRARIVQHFQIQ
jgi:hypothetical protein